MKTVALNTGAQGITTAKKGPYLHQSQGDFSVILIGTGNPQTVIGRGFPSTLVRYKEHYFLVDVGDGTVMQLAQAGIPIGKIENVLFTHHHADHDAGYPYFYINSGMNNRQKLDVVGPPSTKEFYEFFAKFYEKDMIYRATHHGEGQLTRENEHVREIEDKATFELDGVTISTAKLTHTAHNIGYRFEVDGKVIVVSGDTTYDPALPELAKGADILVLDAGPLVGIEFIGASNPYLEGTPPPPRTGPGFSKGKGPASDKPLTPPHPNTAQVAQMAMEAGVKTLVLTHLVPMSVDADTAIAKLQELGYNGNIVIGHDLLEILP